MVSFEIVSLVAFATVIGLWLLSDRKNKEMTFKYGFIIRRWTKGLELIDKVVSSHPRLITIVGNIGIGIGVLAGLGGLAVLIYLTINLQQAFQLVLPTAGGYQIPGPVISIPFWYWLTAIFIIVVTHESMHAVFARLENVKVKNYGILMLLLLPIGAFVDPDEKRIKKLGTIKKLRIFAAGSLANFITAIIGVIVLISSVFLFTSATKNMGVAIESVEPGSPADKAGLEGTITEINAIKINNSLDFAKALNSTKAGDTLDITTDRGVYKLALEIHPKNENRTYMGVSIRNAFSFDVFGLQGIVSSVFYSVFFTVISFLNWLIVISAGVGTVNMLPMKPLDGGLFFEEIFTKVFGDNGKKLILVSSYLILGLLLLNLFGLPLLKSIL
ncbi:MAG: site-2 protease family protein [Candidatus Aenigmarchaeota archaeon]|nr:site-2 protease family protein [Candidatus Aenigmarchaeota archaeon]